MLNSVTNFLVSRLQTAVDEGQFKTMKSTAEKVFSGESAISKDLIMNANERAVTTVEALYSEYWAENRRSMSKESTGFSKEDYNGGFVLTQAQKDAAAYSSMLSLAGKTAIRSGTGKIPAAMPSLSRVDSITRGTGLRAGSVDAINFESYNELDLTKVVPYSMTYNIQSSRQSQMGEANYPTITIPPDRTGIVYGVDVIKVMDQVDRGLTGAAYNMAQKDLIRAYADYQILRRDVTLCVPVFRAGTNDDKFVDDALVTPVTVVDTGESILTQPLKFGVEVDYIGISQTNAQVSKGSSDQTDGLEPGSVMKTALFQFGDDIIEFNISNIPYNNFVHSAQDDYNLTILNMDTTSIILGPNTVQKDGSALVSLAGVVTNNLTIRLRMVLTGRQNIYTNNTTVYSNSISIHSVSNANGQLLALTDPLVAPIKALIDAGEGLGYEMNARRSNKNRRFQGQFLDTVRRYQEYSVRHKSPLSSRHPSNVDASVDSTDLQALITATNMKIDNDMIGSLLESADIMHAYQNVVDENGERPDILGLGRYLLIPAYKEVDFDALNYVDSLSSKDRQLAISEAIMNVIRQMVYELYTVSEYPAVARTLYGGQAPIPVININTDPIIGNYLMITGDVRTVGPEFDYRIYTHIDYRLAGKIIITFGVNDGQRNSGINVLQHGNLLYAPEMVVSANISRNNTYNRETTVQPRYQFINNGAPVGRIHVSNIPNVLRKLPLNVVDVGTV